MSELKNREQDADEALKQDCSAGQDSSCVFLLQLLFEERVAMPLDEKIRETLKRHIGSVEKISHSEDSASYAALDYPAASARKINHSSSNRMKSRRRDRTAIVSS